MRKHFVNLTNGIEAIRQFNLQDYAFLRIQSTACEQKRWPFILDDLDANFLMSLALGHTCIIYDYGHNGKPRSLWQGCEWIRYALERRWYGRTIRPSVHGHNVGAYFDACYSRLPDTTLRRLDYFGKFASGGAVNIEIVWGKTYLDGKYHTYAGLLEGADGTLVEKARQCP